MTTLRFDEAQNQYVLEGDPAPPPPAGPAPMQAFGVAGTLEGLARTEILGLPIGGVALGTAVAVGLDRLIGNKVSAWGMLGQLGVAWGVKQFGSRFLGDRTADAAAFVITYSAVAGMIEEWINSVWPGSPAAPQYMPSGAGLALPAPQSAVVRESVAQTGSGYYSKAFGW